MPILGTGEVNRAPNVCQTCAERKKACDKALPVCGFCTKRDILCDYATTKPRQGGRRHNPGRNFVAVPTPPASANSWDELDTTPACNVPVFQSTSQSFDTYVHWHACRILQATNLSWESVGYRYFRTFDRSLPIISAELFNQVLLKLGNTITPPADHSLLLLGMLLAIEVPELETIAMTLKALVAQAQAVLYTSLQLIQAAFLIAACEYITGKPEAAYVSIVSCIGMARVLGIGGTQTNPPRSVVGGCGSRSMEMANVAWAIAMLERIILCEMQQKRLRPLTDLLGPDIRSNVCDIESSMIEQQARAIALLDQVLEFTNPARDDEQKILMDLAELNNDLQCFLGTFLAEIETTKNSPPPMVALTVRLLFLLHGAVGSTRQPFSTEIPYRDRVKSWDTLDVACNMVVDISRYNNLDRGDMMPIVCYYNLRAAIEHLQRRYGLDGAERDGGMKYLLESERQYRRRWCVWEDVS